ncbi:putative membrane protein [Fimbriiglobus ruber]|uniref:Putative membrane protein n=1 Tax=Fimbriiglobus ruber TaxID=1908690 RepID=A0A225DUB6_9BACT|nr:putative membrane protein [Fimbriiglobus ruber]
MPGWVGKVLVLVLLGFVATDLVFTRTFSAADAAEHLTRSPFGPWQGALESACVSGHDLASELPEEVSSRAHGLSNRQVVVALILLVVGSVVAWVFGRGITRGLVRVAVVATGMYLLVTTIIIGSGIVHLVAHPELVQNWHAAVFAGGSSGATPQSTLGWWPLALACVVLFPKLALGLSGYELALTSMPLVRGRPDDDWVYPRGRIRATRYLLISIALLMAVLLLTSTLVTTILIPAEALASDGPAANRALAYLAHGGPLAGGIEPAAVNPLFGPWFGVVYDAAAVTMLTLAGVTVMIGMRDLIPPYLYRLGMDWKWSQRFGLLTYLFTFLKLGVIYVYSADVDSQRGAYLTGVLSIFTAAAFTAVLDVWKRRAGQWVVFRVSPLFLTALVLFAGSTVVVVWAHPAGLHMTLWFVGATMLVSMVTRFFRNTELRFTGFEFADEASRHLWQDLIAKDYSIIVPLRPNGTPIAQKEVLIRKIHRIPADMPVVFVQTELGDASDFAQLPRVRVCRENGRVVAHITRCTSVPHVLAAAALEIAREGMVPEVHFGWSSEHPLTANLNFVLFGQGNVPWMVYELIQAADVPAERKPRVVVG